MLYLTLSLVVFMIGVFSLVVNRSIVKTLIAIELIATAASMNFIVFAWMRQDVFGQTLMVLALSVDTIITGVALALIITIYRQLKIKRIDQLRWLGE